MRRSCPQVGGAVAAALKRVRGKMSALRQQMGADTEAAATQRRADMIIANVYRWAQALEMT